MGIVAMSETEGRGGAEIEEEALPEIRQLRAELGEKRRARQAYWLLPDDGEAAVCLTNAPVPCPNKMAVTRLAYTVRIAVLVTTLVFAGCAFRVASERPITVTMGPSERIRQICTEAVGRPAIGCLIREGGRLIVFCPYNDVRCLAHELQYAVEPD